MLQLCCWRVNILPLMQLVKREVQEKPNFNPDLPPQCTDHESILADT